MARDDLISVEGKVEEASSGGNFIVRLDDDRLIQAKLSGRLRRFHINVIPGDKVTVGLSPYDVTHGLILRREKVAHHRPGSRKR